jgi:hypothetical protein
MVVVVIMVAALQQVQKRMKTLKGMLISTGMWMEAPLWESLLAEDLEMNLQKRDQ